MDSTSDTVALISCGGYVFNMSDGSRFRQLDIEPVKITAAAENQGSSLSAPTSASRKRKYVDENQEWSRFGDDSSMETLSFHICNDSFQSTNSIHLGENCASWLALSLDQKDALCQLRMRVDSDRAKGNHFTCAIIEGPGGCGKTRLMAHVMNHSYVNTLSIYVTKQNKRVQDFVHTDCLNGEPNPTVHQPVDLTTNTAFEIRNLIEGANVTGRYAVTAEKLIYALASLTPRKFDRDATVTRLGIQYETIQGRQQKTVMTANNHDPSFKESFKSEEGILPTATSNTSDTVTKRNVILLMDEYTMLQPPLIHAIIYYVRHLSKSTVILLMGGDKHQCGPVGWNDSDGETVHSLPSIEHYTGDVRNELIAKLDYVPLELKMENLQRCRDDPALGACIRRLGRVCGERASQTSRYMVNRVLAMYCLEAGVDLFRKETDEDGISTILRVVPVDKESLEACNSLKDFDKRMSLVDEEDLDTRVVEFTLSADEPIRPTYNILPLVRHYTELFVKLAEIDIAHPHCANELWPNVVHESTYTVRHLFPAVLVLRNSLCNVFAETFLLALSTKVRECVSNAPMPSHLVDKILPQTWTSHLQYILRRCIRRLTINKDVAIQRQTLFIGMIYKMTYTMRVFGSKVGLCNGEPVVLTSIMFDSNTLDRIDSVVLRKLDGKANDDLVLRAGLNENRMTGAKKVGIMPFVPYVSESIYQMQGNTICKNAKTFVDMANVPSRSAYVAISRFQNSASIQGIVITE